MDVFESVISNLNTWLVVLGVGVIVWGVRQVLPAAVEETRLWKVLLRVVPMGLGAALALIPGLRPIPENMTQSAVIGLIGGSFSQSAYDLLRELVGDKLKAMMGSRAKRLSMAPPKNPDDSNPQPEVAADPGELSQEG